MVFYFGRTAATTAVVENYFRLLTLLIVRLIRGATKNGKGLYFDRRVARLG